ncbi:MAG: class I SAM-dependent methyltransferase [Dehalococcoidia bacterium]|nr:class I SAM-dependent methyltransferase [Dehalococcoidia bacterium]
MNKTDFDNAKDRVRERLTKFTAKAFQMLPRMEDPRILDVGCGTGVPTLRLAQLSSGHITAIDIDQKAIRRLQQKILQSGLSDRVRAFKQSMLNMDFPKESFDIIWAEGSIDHIGFERGLKELGRFLKPRGCLAVHDHNSNLAQKLNDIPSCGYELLGYFKLDEQTWRKEYFFPMQRLINETRSECAGDGKMLALLDKEQKEIDVFKTDPASRCSVFFVMRKW